MNIPKTREQADALLAEMGRARIERQQVEARMNERLQRITQEAAKEVAPLMRLEHAAELALKAWFKTEKKNLGGAKSLALTFGEIGTRASSQLKLLRSEESVIRSLRTLFRDAAEAFIRSKESVNKDAIRDQWSLGNASDAAHFERAGLLLKGRETFFAEPDLKKLENGGGQ
jgi:phage host-nuclease inhibitor protein Gam